MHIIIYCVKRGVLTYVYLGLAGGYWKYESSNKEYNVSSKNTNKQIELDITWYSYVSSLPLSIVV